MPPFLVHLLTTHLDHLDHLDNDYVFTTPERQWHRRSNFSRRAFRPAADGTPPAQPHPDTPPDTQPDIRQPSPRTSTPQLEPIKPGLTFHGLRHSHKTWMIADLVPEIAQSRRLGHTLPNKIQQTYSHVADEVEQHLLTSLQNRWDNAVTTADARPHPWRQSDRD